MSMSDVQQRQNWLNNQKTFYLHIMYEVGFEYEVSNTEAPWLGLVVSILDTFEVIQTSWKLKCFFFSWDLTENLGLSAMSNWT